MRNTMHKKDLKKADGFPIDIDRDKIVVVIVYEVFHCRIFYYGKNGKLYGGIVNALYPKFAEGIYILK